MMKKNFPKILAGCTAMVLMTGALLVPSMAVNASAHQAVPHLQQASYIGEAKAKEIALNHAGVDASKVSWIFAKQDYDHGPDGIRCGISVWEQGVRLQNRRIYRHYSRLRL